MSSLHISEDGRGMLDLVDKLRSIDKIERTIPLPQIVVVGQQSSGKSSVLHAISGIQFPIDDGICTQFPTEIILRREDVVRTKASIRHAPVLSEERRSEMEAFETTWRDTRLSNLGDIIADAKKVMHLDDRRRFTDESLLLEISGPKQEHLTLIDLPGFFVSTQTGQSSEDITLVNEIAKRYVSNPRAVVLAIVSGKNDFENQLIFEELKVDGSFRQRTLGVITAPDAIEPGSRREADCIQLVQRDPRNLGYGWHVVRNLKFSELKAGVFDRDSVETQFFEQTAPWKGLNSIHVGSQALKQRLSSILKGRIAESMPEIQQEIDLKLEQIYTELKALGKARESPGELREYLCERARMFGQAIDVMLSGSPPAAVGRLSDPTPSLRAYVQSKHQDFANEMFDRAHGWTRDNNGKNETGKLRQIWAGELDGTATIYSDSLAEILFEEISKHRGRELSNLLHPDWAATIFRRQAQRWPGKAKNHGDTIYGELSNRVYQAVETIVEEDVADKLLHEIVEPALRQRNKALNEKLQEVYHPYTLQSIYCVSRKYKASLDACPVDPGTSEYTQCCNILRSAEAFYEVSVDVFTENVINLGIEHCLLHNLPDILSPSLFYRMEDEKLKLLAGESAEAKKTRQRLLAEQEQFEEARDHILPAFSKQRSRRGNLFGTTNPTAKDELSASKNTIPAPRMAGQELYGAVTAPKENNGNPPIVVSTPNRASNESKVTTPSITTSDSSSRYNQSISSVSSYSGSPIPTKVKNNPTLSHSTSPSQSDNNPSTRIFKFTGSKIDSTLSADAHGI